MPPGGNKWELTLSISPVRAVLVLLVLAEALAWCVDHELGYRAGLLDFLAQSEISSDLAPSTVSRLPEDIQIPIRVREPADAHPLYVLAGKTIPGAVGAVNRDFVSPEQLPKLKSRIFILGESAAFGFPFPYQESLAANLNSALRSKGYDFVNAAQVGWTSGELVPLARRIVDHFQPTALIIYMGNNEWVHWAAPGTGGLFSAMVSTLKFLSYSRAFSGFLYFGASIFTAHQEAFRVSHPLLGVAHALENPLERHVAFDAQAWFKTKKKTLDAFEDNLSQIVKYARDNGVRVILLNVPFNYRLSPSWKHPQPESFNAASGKQVHSTIVAAAKAAQGGRCEETRSAIQGALAQDPYPPVLNYLQAMCLESQGRLEEAGAAYALGRENVIGCLGSVLSINDRISKVAVRFGVDTIDIRKLFDAHEHALGRYFNEDLIADDCHPTPLGTKLIAKAVEQRVNSP